MTWDTSIHFGKGKPKGSGPTGFHLKATPGGFNKHSVFTGLLWRGDSRDPDTIFKDGFQMHKAGVEVHGRTTSNVTGVSTKGTTRGGISMSKSIGGAGMWAHDGNYIYLIYLENDEWVAEIEWNANGISKSAVNEAKRQLEFLALQVPSTAIVAGRQVSVSGPNLSFKGVPKINAKYKGSRSVEDLKSDWAVKKMMTAGVVEVLSMNNAAEFSKYEKGL